MTATDLKFLSEEDIVMVPGNSYSGEALEAALKEGKLPDARTTVTGMVKRSEKSGYVAFTRFGCETWVDVPIAMIESAQSVGERGCRDHSHPLMVIGFKEPKDTEGRTLLALLAQTGASPPYPSTRVPIAADLHGVFGRFGNFGLFGGHPDEPTIDPGCEWVLKSCGPGKGVPPWWPCWVRCCWDKHGNTTCT